MANDNVTQFRNAMRSFGLEPPDVIIPGTLHRFPGVGKRNGNTAGWCKLFPDELGGCFGDWSSDLSEHWQAKHLKSLDPIQQEAHRRQVAEARAQAEADRLAGQAKAAQEAAALWEQTGPASDDHPYLVRKGVQAHGARLYEGTLLIPLYHGDTLQSLQRIWPDGKKRFFPNSRTADCHFHVSDPDGAKILCIAEGFATGASIHQATGHPVVVAFQAKNLEGVARAMRERYPEHSLIVCADDDAATPGNPGRTHATAAARAVGGLLAIPDFGETRPEGVSDFNDLAALSGPEAVHICIAKAALVEDAGTSTQFANDWPEPAPLITQIESEPYPLEALPATVQAAVKEVQGFTKAPVALVASAALGSMSLAIQALVNVQRADKLLGPVSLFLLTIADPGERKSTCDQFFTTAIREYQEQQAEAIKPELAAYHAELATWEAKRAAILDAIRKDAKAGKATNTRQDELRMLELEKPVAPRVPKLMRGDETPENLAWVLAREWPSGGVISAEAGIIFGAHGMGKDSIMRNLSLLNILWDGGTLDIGRRTSESFAVKGARLTIGLQVQETTLRSFFDRSGGLARGIGFLSRFLLAWPESTQGSRFYSDPPENWPALNSFNHRITEILSEPVSLNDAGALNPQALSLNPEAKTAFMAFYNAIECQLGSGGDLHDVRDVASKIADNVARLAALFQVFEHGIGGAVSLNAFQGACRVAAWHLNQAQRFFGELVLPPEDADAARLDHWLRDYCRRERTACISRRAIQRHVTPVHLRQKSALDAALHTLIEAERVRLVLQNRRKDVLMNPALIEAIPRK